MTKQRVNVKYFGSMREVNVEIVESEGSIIPVVDGYEVITLRADKGNEKGLIEAVQEVYEVIIEKQQVEQENNNNYGLLYYAEGTNGARQQAMAEHFKEYYNVDIF